MNPDLIEIAEAAQILNLSPSMTYKLLSGTAVVTPKLRCEPLKYDRAIVEALQATRDARRAARRAAKQLRVAANPRKEMGSNQPSDHLQVAKKYWLEKYPKIWPPAESPDVTFWSECLDRAKGVRS